MSSNLITITVQNRVQAQVLHSIMTASNALRRAANAATAEMTQRSLAITEGRGVVYGLGTSTVTEVLNQESRLQALLETAGYVGGLSDADVRQVMAEEFVKIDFTEQD